MNKPFKNTIGLDIRDSAITAVELAVSKKGLKVVNFSRVELDTDVVDENCIIVNPDAFKSAMNRLLQEAYAGPMKAKNVIVSMPEEKTFTHNLCIPHENISDDEYITDSAKDFIPIELSEAATDFRILNTCGSKKEVKYSFVAVQKSIVESLIDILGEIGLKVVFVDVDKNSMIRACHNRFQKASGDFMVVNIDENLSTFSINNTTTGGSYTLDSEIAGFKILESVKEEAEIDTISEVKKILDELYSKPEIQEDDKYTKIGSALQTPLNNLIKEILELANIADNQDSVKVKTIYLIGSHSRIPGIKEVLEKVFPEAEIVQNFQYIQLNENTELYYAEAIGLALRAVLPDVDENEINLLPKDNKEELLFRVLTPIVTKSLFAITLVLSALLVFSGMMTAKTYINLKVSDKELELSNEKAQNPYLHRAAQDTQQKSQLASQLGAILQDSVPAGYLMDDIDAYNNDGIALVSVSYKLNTDGTNNVRLRAKTKARSETEKFIAKLEDSPLLENIVSPLSNLTGKGERFINIDFGVVMEAMINSFNKENGLIDKEETNEDKPKPKRPSIKPAEEQPKEVQVESDEAPAKGDKVEGTDEEQVDEGVAEEEPKTESQDIDPDKTEETPEDKAETETENIENVEESEVVEEGESAGEVEESEIKNN